MLPNTPTADPETVDDKDNRGARDAVQPPYSVFSPVQKQVVVLLCAIAGFFSPFSAFTYFPALEYIADDLNTTIQLLNITITAYLVVQGIVPAFCGELADQIGRRPVYLVVLLVYFIGCLGLALQRNYAALLVLRMVQSAGSSGTIALGIVVVADIAPPHERGSYVGAMLTGPNSGPSIGPVIGGVLAEKAGWPWTFWMLVILSGGCLILFSLFFPETCRNVVGNGSIPTSGFNKAPLSLIKQVQANPTASKDGARFQGFPNPLRCVKLMLIKEDALILWSNALFYINYSVLQAALAPLVMDVYSLNSLQAGLCFLPYGMATVLSSYLMGIVMDRDYQAMAKAHNIALNREAGDDINSIPVEEARIRSIWYAITAAILATLGFGWSVQYKAHISVPLIMTFICGVANTGVFNNCMTLMVDIHPNQSGLASVAVSLARCIAAAIGVSVQQLLIDSIGFGWTFTIFGLICTLAVPMLLMVRLRGPRWRGVEI